MANVVIDRQITCIYVNRKFMICQRVIGFCSYGDFQGLFIWARLTGLARLPRWNWFLFIWRLSARFPRSRLEKPRSRQPSQPALSYEHVEIFLKGSRDVPRSRKPGQPGQPGSYEEALSPLSEIPVGKTEISATEPACSLIWTRRDFFKGIKGCVEISETGPARSTGLIWRGPKLLTEIKKKLTKYSYVGLPHIKGPIIWRISARAVSQAMPCFKKIPIIWSKFQLGLKSNPGWKFQPCLRQPGWNFQPGQTGWKLNLGMRMDSVNENNGGDCKVSPG